MIEWVETYGFGMRQMNTTIRKSPPEMGLFLIKLQ